jgi:acetyl esterase
MPVEPATQAMLDLIAAEGGPALGEMTVHQAREVMTLIALTDGDPEPVASIVDRKLGPINARVYWAGDVPAVGAPCLVWYHGGGWVIGDLQSADTTARKLANRTGAVVVSVDYSLAPEHRFPAGPDDCGAALDWVLAHPDELGIDPTRVAVGGDSAGGNLAAVVAIGARNRGVALTHQLLVYPATDATMSLPSYQANAEGYLLTRSAMEWFYAHYIGDHDPKDPRVSPLFADDLSDVAPATVITAEYDPLRDEGNAYAERLREAGIDVVLRCYEGQIHGFFGLSTISSVAGDAMDLAVARLRREGGG